MTGRFARELPSRPPKSWKRPVDGRSFFSPVIEICMKFTSSLTARFPFRSLSRAKKPKGRFSRSSRTRVDSVLLATSSFWQGIDVPGEALSCVIIDKLPFEVPDDPVIAARVDRISRSGGNAFYEYQVPRAAIQLKQGIGRLHSLLHGPRGDSDFRRKDAHQELWTGLCQKPPALPGGTFSG